MSGNRPWASWVEVSLGEVQVCAAHSAHLNLDEHLAGAGDRIRQLDEPERLSVHWPRMGNDPGPHADTVPSTSLAIEG